MRFKKTFALAVGVLVATWEHGTAQQPSAIQLWLTNAARTQLMARQKTDLRIEARRSAMPTILLQDGEVDQPIDGFGFAMTGGSAQLIHRLTPAKRHAFLEDTFGRGPGQAGVSYLRVSIGASDMNDHVFTYDDMPAGQTDPSLTKFSLAEDDADLIPVLREVLAIAPGLQILASPWSAPSWMKTVEAPKGGSLRPEFRAVYAAYLVRYLQGMQAHGIPIAAITMQNEPLNPKNTPSMVMQAAEQEAFLRDFLGPGLDAAGLHPKVVLYDHNCDQPAYPLTILSDSKAQPFADGSGFHLYGGEISAMTVVHDAYPAKNLYFTEQMVVEHTRDGVLEPVAQPVARVLIGAMRNWSRTVLLWNLAADPSFGPHTSDGGCPVCQGAVTINGDQVTRNIAFYTIEHASEFVPPGSVRIGSTETDPELANVAFRTRSGGHVLVVANIGKVSKPFTVGTGSGQFATSLDAGSVGTYVW